MFRINTMLSSAVLGGFLALSATTFNTEASILIQDWNGAGESGFGSIAMGRNDDGSSPFIAFDSFEELNFDSGVNFFGTTYNGAFINNNGNITFNSSLGNFTPETFPVTSQPMIAPFWGDVDTRCSDCGEVYIGSPNENTVVVTWNEVGFYPSNSSLTNTFQLVLIDRADTGSGNFDVEFRYEDINWTTGNASDGESGLGGIPAQAGFDAGNDVNFFIVPGSQTSDVVDLDTAPSNTDTAGIWTFGIRDGEFEGATADNPILPVTDPDNPGNYSFEFAITDGDPIFIDPDVAIGYEYIVDNGPNIASVILPDNIGDGFYDLWLWNTSLLGGTGDWYDAGIEIQGGLMNEYTFSSPTDRFRIMGIEIDAMLDPTDSAAFVTGLTFNGTGIVNMNQNAVVEFVPDPLAVPEPKTLLLFVAAFAFMVRKRFHFKK